MSDYPVARNTDPGTSWAAARSVENLRKSQQAILQCLNERLGGKGTDEQIATAYDAHRHLYGWPMQSPSGLRTRRAELVVRGLVEDSGTKARTRAGRMTIVWQRAGMSGRLF